MTGDAATVDARTIRWARRTIALTFSVRGLETGKPLNDPEAAGQAAREAFATAEELWQAAAAECGSTATPNRMAIVFAKNVLNWAAKHRSPAYAPPPSFLENLPL